MDPLDDRLTILERAQLLHDSTLRRHGEMLDRHEEERLRHEDQIRRLTAIQEGQHRLLEDVVGLAAQHQERMDRLEQLLQAIREMLDRGNGH